MNKKEILKKIINDRKSMSDDMMYFYTEEECQESFGMSIDTVKELMPIEFNIVVTIEYQGNQEYELTTWGDFEEVYDLYTKDPCKK